MNWKRPFIDDKGALFSTSFSRMKRYNSDERGEEDGYLYSGGWLVHSAFVDFQHSSGSLERYRIRMCGVFVRKRHGYSGNKP